MTPFLRLLVYLTADDCGKEVQMKGTPRKLTMLHAKGYDYNRNVPSVLLSGLWLKDCGFAPGEGSFLPIPSSATISPASPMGFT